MFRRRTVTRSIVSGPTRQRWSVFLTAVFALWSIFAPQRSMLAQTPGTSQDDRTGSAAGFIVDTGDDEPVYVVVAFDEPSMTAIDLLRSADLSSVTVEFGGLGEGVCSIATTGCDVATCRQRLCQTGDPESPFWQYWLQGDDGSWGLSPLGASHVEIGDGDIGAWIWTGVEPELEPLVWDELASRAGAPDSVAQGEAPSEPAVYTSGLPEEPKQDDMTSETITAIGAVLLLATLGGWLVLRQRREHRPRTP